jgi:hypothetical protein
MNEDWKAREGGGGRTGNSLLKRMERRGETATSLVGQWDIDSMTLPRLHRVFFVLLILVCLTAL